MLAKQLYIQHAWKGKWMAKKKNVSVGWLHALPRVSSILARYLLTSDRIIQRWQRRLRNVEKTWLIILLIFCFTLIVQLFFSWWPIRGLDEPKKQLNIYSPITDAAAENQLFVHSLFIYLRSQCEKFLLFEMRVLHGYSRAAQLTLFISSTWANTAWPK